MNSAAVIGRQLRQQNTGRGPLPPGKGRPRALSHQPLCTPQQQAQLQAKEEEEKIGCIQSIRNKVTIECLWLTCKALSGGMILLIIGTTMSVVGFYADTLSTEVVDAGNTTAEVTDVDRQYHLHNLTYVGPVLMGLGGFVIVAAFVMTFDGHDSGAKVVPIKDDRATADGSLLTSLLVDDHLSRDKPNAPTTCGPYLCVPQAYDIPPEFRRSSVTLTAQNKAPATISSNGKVGTKELNEAATGAKRKDPQVLQVAIPNGPNKCSSKSPNKPTTKVSSSKVPSRVSSRAPSRESTPSLALVKRESSKTSDIHSRNRERMMMQLCLGDFVPSPQDIEIIDPDGCETPLRNSRTSSSMDMEVYVSNCPITVRVQVEPRHLASMESDGLSDSDISDHGEIARISRRDFDFTEQEMPLLGRCSPALSSPESRRPETTIQFFKRDSNRRFPLLRQGALDNVRSLDGGQAEATFT